GAVEEHRRQKLVAEDHHQHETENGLRDLRVGGWAEMGRTVEENGAKCKRDDAEGHLLQNGCAEGGVFASQAEQWLDLLLPCIEVFLDFAGEDLAELRIDAADVRGQGLDRGQQNQHEDDKRGHGRRAFAVVFGGRRFEGACCIGAAVRSINPCGRPRRPRKRRSRRSICPESASWSYPARCNSPCRMRTLISVESEWPCPAAWRKAVETLMARSPAIFSGPCVVVSAGNESTSVALFLPRKRRFRSRIAASVVSRIVTWPLSRIAACARVRKRPRVRAVGRWKSADFAGALDTIARFTDFESGVGSRSS